MATASDRTRPYLGLAVLMLAVLLISVDATVLSFALPALSADLDPTGAELLWIVDSYGFTIAALLITMGTLGDHIGRRRVLLGGAAVFGLASAFAALATTVPQLIAARVLLGVGGATLMPATLSLIRTLFPDDRERTRAIAIWAAMFSVGSAAGPLVGGAILEHFHWSAVFLINLPVVALLLLGGPLLLPESRNPNPGRFDVPGALLSVAAIVPAVYAVKTVAESGDPNRNAMLALLLAALALAAFVRRLRTARYPLIDPGLFADRVFSVTVVVNALSMFVLIGLLFVLSQFLQGASGLSPLAAGVLLLPGLAASALASLAVGFAAGRFLPRTLLAAGMALAGVGATMIAFARADQPLLVAAAFAVLGVGLGMVDPVTNDIIVSSVPPERTGAASAVSEVGYELGGAFGTAVLGSVLMAGYTSGVTRWLTGATTPPGVDLAPATHTIGAARELAEQLGGPLGSELMTVAGNAFAHAAQTTAAVAAAVAFGSAILVAVIPVRPKGEHPPTLPSESPRPDDCSDLRLSPQMR